MTTCTTSTGKLIANLTDNPIAPGTTPVYEMQLLDGAGNGIPAAALNTLTLTICDTSTQQIINGCQDANILNTGRGTVDALGNVQVQFLAADTALEASSDAYEYRSLVLRWTFNSGVGIGEHQVNLLIQPLIGS